MRITGTFAEAAVNTATNTPKMRVTGTFVEAGVNKAFLVPALRLTGTFVEVAVRNPPPGGWSVGSIRIA